MNVEDRFSDQSPHLQARLPGCHNSFLFLLKRVTTWRCILNTCLLRIGQEPTCLQE